MCTERFDFKPVLLFLMSADLKPKVKALTNSVPQTVQADRRLPRRTEDPFEGLSKHHQAKADGQRSDKKR